MKKHTTPTTAARRQLQLGRTTMRELTAGTLATVEGAKPSATRDSEEQNQCWPVG